VSRRSIVQGTIVLSSFLFLAFALPDDALSQTSSAVATGVTSEADAIHQEAVALYTDPSRHGQAARLLRQECELRAPEDPATFRCLSMGARLFYYTGELLDARAMMEEAADNALQRGDVMAAARSYLEAASIALKQNRGEKKAAELIGKGRLLSSSPLLSDSQRGWIQAKIGVEAPGLASGADR
jgi:hypothetical protein